MLYVHEEKIHRSSSEGYGHYLLSHSGIQKQIFLEASWNNTVQFELSM